MLTEIPAGVESGWHLHPGEEVGYILAGTVEMKIKGQPTLTLHAGDAFLIPPRTPHNALDVGPDTGQMLSTYIVEVGQPLASSPVDGSRSCRKLQSCHRVVPVRRDGCHELH